MHYKNGKEAKIGDRVVYKGYADGKIVPKFGILVDTQPSCTTCNGLVVDAFSPKESVTLGECLHMDDSDLVSEYQNPKDIIK